MSKFPAGLIDWSGNRAGGVRRLFHDKSGRPSGTVIRTGLLDRLDEWARAIAQAKSTAARIVLLVGGPGNGKTEAVEYTIVRLDAELRTGGRIVQAFQQAFNPEGPKPPPRIAAIGPACEDGTVLPFAVQIVQDASAPDEERQKIAPAELFVAELENALRQGENVVYLACVNRGILDDALIYATEAGLQEPRDALLAIIAGIENGPASVPCWPLGNLPSVAAWPMDIETLLASTEPDSPGKALIGIAANADSWPPGGTCEAGENCPFCYSRERLAQSAGSGALLRILRWFELANGKRWSFRDLSSLLSYLLAGTRGYPGSQHPGDPCAWAASLMARPGPERVRLAVPFILVAAQYQHALFGGWPQISTRQLRRDLDQLGLRQDQVLAGLHYFLVANPVTTAPPTLLAQLASLSEALDPALAHPDTVVQVSESTQLKYRELDARFSQSVGEGMRYLLKGARRAWLSPNEIRLLELLARADERISALDLARKHPAAVFRVQKAIRVFACSIARRSLGVRAAAVRDWEVLAEYEKVVGGDKALLQGALKQLQVLLNDQDKFKVCLNTTFGEPMPPPERRAMLVTPLQKVKTIEIAVQGRPPQVLPYFRIGPAQASKGIPLTYDLFKAGSDLRRGMLPASLPRPVVALIDATRARLAGQLVRNADLLEDAEIQLGRTGGIIGFEGDGSSFWQGARE